MPQPASALDGNIKSRWSSGHHQTGGEWFETDMGSTQPFTSVTMNAGSSTGDCPRQYQVYISNDGSNWDNPVAQGKGSSAVVTVTFPTQSARYIKVVQTGAVSYYWWSIAEFTVNS